jgi:hypothetical protein
MKLTAILLCVLVLAGCAKKSEHSTKVGPEKTYYIERLFTYEECTVYRFYDVGRYVHYTNCKGSTIENHSCGKNCLKSSEITTNEN